MKRKGKKVMVGFIIFIIILCIVISKKEMYKYNEGVNVTRLMNLLKKQRFSEIKTKQLNGNITIITANNLGENFLYAMRNDITSMVPSNIETIYEYSKKEHIHNTIVIVKSLKDGITDNAKNKAKEYNIDVIEGNELIKMLDQEKASILKTSDTSDDTCEIDYSQNEDPRSEKSSILKELFKGPDRL